MHAEIIVALSLAPYLTALWLLYRAVSQGLKEGRFGIGLALTPLWLSIIVIPWAMLGISVPTANAIYSAIPSLRVAAWDVGLALNLSLGMVVSYITGALFGLWATFRLVAGCSLENSKNVANEH